MKTIVIAFVLACTMTVASTDAQTDSSREATRKPKAIVDPGQGPDVLGELKFFDGVPIGETNERVYDNLTRCAALGVYLDNVGAVSINSVLDGMAKQGADAPNKVAICEQLMDSQTPVVTSNTSTLYAYSDGSGDGWSNGHRGPARHARVSWTIAWQRFVGNMGVTGPDKGKGGKYLVIPPGYEGEIPDGYFLLKPPTNRNFLFLRGSIKDGLEAGRREHQIRVKDLSAQGCRQSSTNRIGQHVRQGHSTRSSRTIWNTSRS